MFQKLAFSSALLFSVVALAQTYEIQYANFSNGKAIPTDNPTIVLVNAEENIIINKNIKERKANYPYEISKVEKPSNTIFSYAYLRNNEVISTLDKESISKQNFEPTVETKKILGYTCKKAITKINSNTIEVWYTNDLKVKGGPSSLGQDLGLVLEITRNGNSTTSASSVKKLKNLGLENLIKKDIPQIDLLSYKDLVWKSKFITLPVFDNETINFSDDARSDSQIKRYANGTIILKKVKFPSIKEGDNIFVELKQKSNGDAYDRTGTVFMIPEDAPQTFLDGLEKGAKTLPIYTNGNGKNYQGIVATENYLPTIELMRFFTPFGISKFNHLELKDKTWQTINPYRQDITELKPSLSDKEIWIGTFIGNYDKGGHKVSLEITIHPSEQLLHKNNKVIPLFNTTNIMEMAGQEYATLFNNEKGLWMEFTLKTDLKNAQLRYITTGHGGWENGDEFIPKKNTILLDQKEVFSFIPWRTDCGSYRLYNPASGNFSDGLSSSDLSRSNWCPGTITNPNYISLGDLKAGKHTIQIKIPQGEPEGGSFSAWNVSGILIGKG